MQWKQGTVAVTNGSSTVTGTGTDWTTADANIQPGDAFLVPGDGVTYTVASVTSDTQLALSAPYGGTTNATATYAVQRDFTSLGLPEVSPGDRGVATLFTRAMREIDDKLVQLGAT